MTRNPHLDREAGRAVAELERRLRPWLPDSLRQQFAERFIDDLIAEHWRHIPPPPDPLARRPVPPREVAERGVAAARAALQGEKDHD